MRILSYPGSKSKSWTQILSYIPRGTNRVLSPFFGGGGLEFLLGELGYKVVGFDLFEDLVNFWRSALEDPVRLQKAIYSYLDAEVLTDEYMLRLRERIYPETAGYDKAAIFWIMNRSSFSNLGFARTRLMLKRFLKLKGSTILRGMSSFSAPNVSVSYGSCFDILVDKRYANDFVYLDPPYDFGEKDDNLYGKDGAMHKGFNHVKLKECLELRKSKWVMSYNGSSYIRELYKDYEIIDLRVLCKMAGGAYWREAEILIFNV